LDQVYELDMALMKEVENLSASLEQLGGAAAEASPQPINDLLRQVDDVQQKFAERGRILQGLGE
jgi:hypothetical protein